MDQAERVQGPVAAGSGVSPLRTDAQRLQRRDADHLRPRDDRDIVVDGSICRADDEEGRARERRGVDRKGAERQRLQAAER